MKNPDEFNLTVDPSSASSFGADEASQVGGTVKLVRYEIPEDLFHDLFQQGHIKVGGVPNSLVLDRVAQDAINKEMGF